MSATLQIGKALQLYCTGQATIVDNVTDTNMTAARSTLIGLIGTRMYPGEVPQTVRIDDGDYLFYSKTGAQYGGNMRGGDGLAFTTFMISGESATGEGRNALSIALITALHGYSGTITYAGESMTVSNIVCESEDEDYILKEEAGNDLIYGFTQTWEIAHEVL